MSKISTKSILKKIFKGKSDKEMAKKAKKKKVTKVKKVVKPKTKKIKKVKKVVVKKTKKAQKKGGCSSKKGFLANWFFNKSGFF